jgi:hypothetical protein
VINDTSSSSSSLEELRPWGEGPSSSSSGLIKIRHGALIITSVKAGHKGNY